MKNRLMGIFATGVLVLGLVGCGSEDKISAEDADVSILSPSSSNYYLDIKIYSEKLSYFFDSTVLNIQSGNVTDINKEELLTITNEFILFSQSFEPEPFTEDDVIFNENFKDLIYDAEKVAEYSLQYIFKKEDVYLTLHKDSFNDSLIHIDTLARLEEKYYSKYK